MPMRTLALIGALFATVPSPVLAADTSCAVLRTTPEFRIELAQAMTMGDSGKSDILSQQLNAAVKACADAAGYDEPQGAAYYDMVLSEISRGWLIDEMAKAGLAHSVIDKALDFGTGRANPSVDENISEEQIGAIISGYIAAGVDIEKVPQQAWEQVGAYVAATGIYWRAAGKLP